MNTRAYTVAFLAGDGIGPELTAQASRAITVVSTLYGFHVEQVHVPFGGESHVRSGQLLPGATRRAALDADALLVAAAREPALATLEAELDLRASVHRVRIAPSGDVVVLGPLDPGAEAWTLERAFEIARTRRASLVAVGKEPGWRRLVDEVAERNDGVPVVELAPADAMRGLAFDPDRFDVVVSSAVYGEALAEIVAATDGRPRVAATGRLAGHGPGVFIPSHGVAPAIAGQGVANPSSMLLAAALMLGEGLGERAAGETLAGAVVGAMRNGVRTADVAGTGLAATTREFMDAVFGQLQLAITNTELYAEVWA